MIGFLSRYWPVIVLWAVSRVWVAMLLWGPESGVTGDVNYYKDSLGELSRHGVSGTLVEYPVPALLLLWLPYVGVRLVGLPADHFVVAVGALAALTDLLFLVLLVRTRRSEPRVGVTGAELLWLAAVPALGGTAYARFDLFPGIMVGLAVLYAVSRPRVAAVFAALATGAKYWPALVVPALAARRSARLRVLATVLVSGAVLALLSLGVGGWHRLFTPLDYQSARGLQIESVAATLAMLAWGHGDFRYSVDYTRWKAYDVSGPTVDRLLTLTTVATIVGGVLIIMWWALAWWRLRRSHERTSEVLVWLVLATVSVFIATNKVLSPQYLLWLLPAAAAGLTLLRGAAAVRLGLWSGVLLAVTLLTHEIFPRFYGYMLQWDVIGSPWITDVLVWRNALLLVLTLYAAARITRLLLTPADLSQTGADLSGDDADLPQPVDASPVSDAETDKSAPEIDKSAPRSGKSAVG